MKLHRPFELVNWIIAILLWAFGIAVIKCPNVVGSKDAAATLAGAVFGAAAIFIGAEIGKLHQRAKTRDDLEENRRRIRTALMPELVRISVNLIETAKFFRRAAELLSTGKAQPASVDLDWYLPQEPLVYEALLNQITQLTEPEIDAIATFYGNLELTRKRLRECKEHGATLNLLDAEAVARSFEHDCSIAAQVVNLLAPTRRIQREGGPAVLLTEALREIGGVGT